MTIQMIITLAIVIGMIVMIMSDKFAFGAPPLIACVLLVLTGCATMSEAFAGFVDDKTVAFTITGSNTLDVPDQGGQQWAFLSETETEYQLLMTKTKNGASYTTFMTKAK